MAFPTVPGPARTTDGFESVDFDDTSWADIAVPGHWQLQGWGARPTPTSITPSRSNLRSCRTRTRPGSTARTFDVAEDFPAGAAVLRFDGVDSQFTAWCNGVELGWSTGSRLATEFDVGPVAA